MAAPLTIRADPAQRPGPVLLEALGAVGALLVFELLLAQLLPATGPAWSPSSLQRTGWIRLTEAVLLFGYWNVRGWRLADLGLTGSTAKRGIVWGLATSFVFGVSAIAAELLSRLAFDTSFFALVADSKIPEGLPSLIFAGVFVGPLVEEIVFRGLVYGALRRRISIAPALMVVTGIFTLAHFAQSGGHSLPWAQAVGGVVFCLVYEKSQSLWAPWLVHALGNFALFALPYTQ